MNYLKWTSVLCVAVSIACGGSKGPTTPSPGTGVPTGMPVVTLTALDIPNRTAQINWTGTPGATEYDIALGTSAGGEQIGKLTLPGSTITATLPNLPPGGTIHIGVTPRNATGPGSRGSSSFYLVDFRAIVETLFLASGPYGESQFGGGAFPTMRGWAPGARIRILLATEVEDLRPTAEKVAAQLSLMTGGVLTAFVESGGDNVWTAPREGPENTVKVVSTREVPQDLCGNNSFDCARADPDRLPVQTKAMLWMGPGLRPGNRVPVFTHELGHALLGFGHWGGYFDAQGVDKIACRPNSPQIQFPYLMMCGRQEEITNGLPAAQRNDFTPLEVLAAQRVYAAGLRAGSPRADFVSRGLIKQ